MLPEFIYVKVGLEIVALSRFKAGVHKYTYPAVEVVPNAAESPEHSVTSGPASAIEF